MSFGKQELARVAVVQSLKKAVKERNFKLIESCLESLRFRFQMKCDEVRKAAGVCFSDLDNLIHNNEENVNQ